MTPGRAIGPRRASVDDRLVDPEAVCPRCKGPLALGADGFWSCPVGHGLGFTLSKAYGRIADDEIAELWRRSESASAGGVGCPCCGRPMVTVTVDGAAAGVCRDDEALWFDAGELDELQPAAARQTPEQERQFAAIVEAFDHDPVAGLEREEDAGVLDRLADHVVRNKPGFARLFDHALYSDRLDELEAETAREQHELAAGWGEP